MRTLISNFLKLEASSGILLIIAAILALIANNTFLANGYNTFLETPIILAVKDLVIHKPLSLWVNDGLMVIFFTLIGLEVKKEVLQGNLSKPSQVILPCVAAIGGMIVPAFIYWFFNHDNAGAHQGWAIPMATDIAFSLGVLSLVGKSVPMVLRLFLMALAIIDDLGAVIVIALFYTADISVYFLIAAVICFIALLILNRLGVRSLGLYIIIGVLLWVCVLKSGVHATIAGVLLAFTIPLKQSKMDHKQETPPLVILEHALQPWVAYFILPLFAFVNAGISFANITQDHLFSSVTIGIVLGLVLGKTIGVFGFSWVLIKCGFAQKPQGVNWLMFLGVSVLCGIGFTMSLFIGSLSFGVGSEFMGVDRLGILIGSFIAAVLGYIIMKVALRKSVG